jgi:hypothetical protein
LILRESALKLAERSGSVPAVAAVAEVAEPVPVLDGPSDPREWLIFFRAPTGCHARTGDEGEDPVCPFAPFVLGRNVMISRACLWVSAQRR